MYSEHFSKKLDFYSYWLTIIIFLTHFGIGWQIELGYLTLPAMSFFFFVSGYHFYLAYLNGSSIKKLLEKRIVTLVVPYVIWNIAAFVSHALFTYLRTGTIEATKWYDIFIVHVGGNACADVPLWYIWRLMSFFVVAKLLYFIIGNKKFGLISILLLNVFNFIYFPSYYSYRFFLPVFLLGGYIALHFGKWFQEYWTNKSRNKLLIRRIIFCVYIIAYLIIFYGYSSLRNMLQYIVVSVSGVAFWIITARTPQTDKNILHVPNAMFLYCFHFILYDWVYAAVRKIVPYYGGDMIDGYKILGYLLTIVLAMVIILGVDYVIKKCFPKVYRILIGGRMKKEM